MSVIVIPEPYYPTEYDRARDELFKMECNCRRMKYMIQNGYCVDEYTDENWNKFKDYLNQNKDEKI